MKKRFPITSSRGQDWQHHKWVHISPIRGSISSPMATLERRCMLTPSSCLSCLQPASMTFSSAIMSTRENNTNSSSENEKKPTQDSLRPHLSLQSLPQNRILQGCVLYMKRGNFPQRYHENIQRSQQSWQPCKNTDINTESRGQKDVWPADTQATSFCWVKTLK